MDRGIRLGFFIFLSSFANSAHSMGQWQKGAIDLKKVIKSVSFNPAIPDELKMIKAINRKGNYSRYIKKLIAADLGLKAAKKQKEPDRETIQAEVDPPEQESPEVIEPPQTYGERLEQMKRERNQNTGGPKLWMP